MNQANILIKKLFGGSDNLTNLTSLGVYIIFQRNDNNELQMDISKIDLYDLIIISLCNFSKKIKDQISPDRLEVLSIIKKGLFEYLGLIATEFEIFMKEVIIVNTNKKRNIDVPKLIDELTKIKKKSNNNLDENELKMKFTEYWYF